MHTTTLASKIRDCDGVLTCLLKIVIEKHFCVLALFSPFNAKNFEHGSVSTFPLSSCSGYRKRLILAFFLHTFNWRICLSLASLRFSWSVARDYIHKQAPVRQNLQIFWLFPMLILLLSGNKCYAAHKQPTRNDCKITTTKLMFVFCSVRNVALFTVFKTLRFAFHDRIQCSLSLSLFLFLYTRCSC